MKIYLCGAVDKSDDLGQPWRWDAEKEIGARGGTAMWPHGLERIGFKPEERSRAKKKFEAYRKHYLEQNLFIVCESDAMLVRWCSKAGLGTQAELANAVWLGIPVAGWWPAEEREKGRPPVRMLGPEPVYHETLERAVDALFGWRST